MDIYLQNTIIDDLQFSDADISLYVALRSLYQSTRIEQVITFNMIMYELYGSTGFKRAAQEKIGESFKKFADMELIKVKEKFPGNEYVVDLSNIYFEGGIGSYYTIIRDSEVHTIMNMDNKMDKFKLLRYYIVCLESINKSQGVYEDQRGNQKTNFVGFMPKDFLCKKIGINYETCKSYIHQYDSVLEDHHLLYNHRHKEMKRDKATGQIKSFTNHYGRYEDRKYIDQFADQYEKQCGPTEEIVRSSKSNEKRSLMQKYNSLVRDFEKYSVEYSEELLIKIYKHVHASNKKVLESMKNIQQGSYYYLELEEKLRDESVFQKIPCLETYLKNDDSEEDSDIDLDDLFSDSPAA